MLKKFAVLAVLTVALSACGKSAETPSRPSGAPEASAQRVILALGDSVTAGYELPPSSSYPAQLEKRLSEAGYRYEVVNA